MDIDQAREKLRQRIETMNKLRGRPLTDIEKLENLKAMMFRCDRCDATLDTLLWDYCPWCGWDLKGVAANGQQTRPPPDCNKT